MLDPNRIKDYISVKQYNGQNDYILTIKARLKKSKVFNPTPKQIEYIQQNYLKVPVVVDKDINVSGYLSTLLQEEHDLPFAPMKFKVVKILSNMVDVLHVMAKFTPNQKFPSMVWIPKKHIVKEKDKNVVRGLDYSKFSHRPPMVHQKEAITKLLEYDRFILADDMGLGKSTSSVLGAMMGGSKKILVICPSSLKLNWKREIEHYDDGVSIISGKKWESGEKWTIVNFDILKNFHSLPEKNKSLSKMKQSDILKTNFDLVIIDEAHSIKNTTSKRTKLVMDFVRNIKKVWLLTGTPVANRPMDFYNLLKICRSQVAQDWIHFVRRYCEGRQFRGKGGRMIWDTKGASNLDELHNYTKDTVLRRKKEDVIDLPPKIITPIYLQLENVRGYQSIMGDYRSWTQKHGHANLGEHMTKLVTLRKFLAEEKTKTTIEMVKGLLEQGKKIIIFTNFNNEQQMLYDEFSKRKCKRIPRE